MKKKIALVCLIVLAISCIALSACQLNNLQLTFVVDGNSYSVIETTGAETITIPNNPEKAGYVFSGWFWDEGVWEKPFTANSLLDASISRNMSVYAKFDAIAYNLDLI